MTSEERVALCYFAMAAQDEAAAVFLEQGLSDDSAEIRSRCAKALSEVGNERSARRLVSLLLSDWDVQVRHDAAYALGWIALMHEPIGERALRDALANKQEASRVRWCAADALTHFPGAYGGQKRNRPIQRVLLECLFDDDPEVRFWCAFALRSHGEATAIQYLVHIVQNDSSADLFLPPEPHTVAVEARESLDILMQAFPRVVIHGKRYYKSAGGSWRLGARPRGGPRKQAKP